MPRCQNLSLKMNRSESQTPKDKKSHPTMKTDHQGPRSSKRPRIEEDGSVTLPPPPPEDLSDDLLLEILKRADGATVARAACVSRRWRELAEDERIWEAVCGGLVEGVGCGARQTRSVVSALGGFRRLHSVYLVPMMKKQASHVPRARGRWGRDEVQLSMALLSIGFFERIGGFGRG